MNEQMLINPSMNLIEANDLVGMSPCVVLRAAARPRRTADSAPSTRFGIVFAADGAHDAVTPFLVVEFATELEEPFIYATMEVASA